jgi:hypothetical protein
MTTPDDARKAQSDRAITPGTIAILLMGWLELIVSFTLYAMMDLPIIAMTRNILIDTLVLALASLGGALWMLIAGDYLVAVLMVLWALSLVIQSTRLRSATSRAA